MDPKDLRLLQLLYHTAQMSDESRRDLRDLLNRLQAPTRRQAPSFDRISVVN